MSKNINLKKIVREANKWGNGSDIEVEITMIGWYEDGRNLTATIHPDSPDEDSTVLIIVPREEEYLELMELQHGRELGCFRNYKNQSGQLKALNEYLTIGCSNRVIVKVCDSHNKDNEYQFSFELYDKIKININDIVYSTSNNKGSLKVVDVLSDTRIVCLDLETYSMIELNRWNVRKSPFAKEEDYVTKRTEKIYHCVNNVCASLSWIYKRYIDGVLNLNPEYQRGLVWNLRQKQDYIVAIMSGLVEIEYIFIYNPDNYECNNKGKQEVLDGKQRLSTVIGFLEGKFPLPNGKYFYDLSRGDRAFFENIEVNAKKLISHTGHNFSLKEKVQMFIELNALGTRVSDKHIDEIKKLYL